MKKQLLVSNLEVDMYGTKRWYNEVGELHRDGDLPAVEWKSGGKEWWINGILDRENDLPTIVYVTGTTVWFNKSGVRYRIDEWIDGDKAWYYEI